MEYLPNFQVHRPKTEAIETTNIVFVFPPPTVIIGTWLNYIATIGFNPSSVSPRPIANNFSIVFISQNVVVAQSNKLTIFVDEPSS